MDEHKRRKKEEGVDGEAKAKTQMGSEATIGLRRIYGREATFKSEGQASAMELVHDPRRMTNIIVLPTSAGKSALTIVSSSRGRAAPTWARFVCATGAAARLRTLVQVEATASTWAAAQLREKAQQNNNNLRRFNGKERTISTPSSVSNCNVRSGREQGR